MTLPIGAETNSLTSDSYRLFPQAQRPELQMRNNRIAWVRAPEYCEVGLKIRSTA